MNPFDDLGEFVYYCWCFIRALSIAPWLLL